MRRAYMICMTMLCLVLPSTATAQTVIDAIDRGWYKNNGSHSTTNKNTITGTYNTSTYNSYFYFNIPAGISCVDSATLELELERYYGDGTPHGIEIYDVSPSHVPLLSTANGSGSGVAIHNDLKSGSLYASQSGIGNSQVGSLITLTLSQQALTDIAAASGGAFAVGGFAVVGGSGSLRALRFSASGEARVHRLTLTQCGTSPDIVVTKTSTVTGGSNPNPSFAVPGSDITYKIELTNQGNAAPDPDSLFLVDRLPPQTVFFNGDFDGTGPGTGPVSVTNSGSGLTFNQTNDLAFSNAASPPGSFAACTYNPASGYDPNVTFVCLNPKGALQVANAPTFAVRFRGKIE